MPAARLPASSPARRTGTCSTAAVAYTAASDALAAEFRKVGVPEADAARRAALLVIAAEGVVLIARARRSTEPLLLVAGQFNSPQA